jgi:hypothetical protein
MVRGAVPEEATWVQSEASHVTVADHRRKEIVGAVQVPASWLVQSSSLPKFFVNVFPEFIIFLVVEEPLMWPIIVGANLCHYISLEVGALSHVVSSVLSCNISAAAVVSKHSDQPLVASESPKAHDGNAVSGECEAGNDVFKECDDGNDDDEGNPKVAVGR